MEKTESSIMKKFSNVMRKKTELIISKLPQNLSLLDLTLMSLGNMLGVGAYNFIGRYNYHMGPAMFVAFVFNGLTCLLSALSYADLMSHGFSGHGGAYTTIYQTIGELPAAILGWLMLWQNIFGAALTTRSLGEMANILSKDSIVKWIKSNLYNVKNPVIAEYPSIVSFLIGIAIFLILIIIIKNRHIKVTNTLVTISLVFLMLLIMIMGSIGKYKYWTMKAENGTCGNGGYAPYGARSVFDYVGLSYLGFCGFEAGSYGSGECPEPERLIPVTTILTSVTGIILYLLESATYTMASPYCSQDADIAIIHMLREANVHIMTWIAYICIPIALIGNILSTYYPLTRIIVAMSEDGLIFECLSKITTDSKIPINALITGGILSPVLSAFLKQGQLCEAIVLTSTITYNIVTISGLYLRHSDIIAGEEARKRTLWRLLINRKPKILSPTKRTMKIVKIACIILLVLPFPTFYIFRLLLDDLLTGSPFAIIYLSVVVLFYGMLCVVIYRQPQAENSQTFRAEPRPFLQVLCILFNAYMSLTLTLWTWVRCSVLLLLGLIIYFSYGMWFSKVVDGEESFYARQSPQRSNSLRR